MLVRSPRSRTAASSPSSIRPGRELDLSSLYEAHHRELFRYCRSILHHDEDAMDALQATFAKAVAALPQETRDIEPRPWLFRVAHNESIGILRRRRTDSDIEDTSIASHRSTDDDATQRADLRQLQEDLADLTERQRQALVLRELSGLGHEEISAILDTTPRAVKQIIYEARTALHDCREGRAVACDEIRRQLSDADGRITRSRRVRAHIRDCSSCHAFQEDLAQRPQRLAAIAPAIPALAGASMLHDLLARGADGVAGEALAGAASMGAAGVSAGSAALGGATTGSSVAGAGAATAATAATVSATGSAGLLSGVAAKVAVVAVLAGGGAGGAVLATDVGDRSPARTAPTVTPAPVPAPPTSAPVATSPAVSPGPSRTTTPAERRRIAQETAEQRRELAAERLAAAKRRAAAAREQAATARERERGPGSSTHRRPASPGAPAKTRPAPAAKRPASPAPPRRDARGPAAKPTAPASSSPKKAPGTAREKAPSAIPPASGPPKPEPTGPAGGTGSSTSAPPAGRPDAEFLPRP